METVLKYAKSKRAIGGLIRNGKTNEIDEHTNGICRLFATIQQEEEEATSLAARY